MRSRLFWPAVVVGWSVMAFGVVGLLGEGRDVPVGGFGRWLVGGAIVHDLVVAPAVLGAALGVRRLLGPPWRAVVGAAFVVAAPVVLFAWPYLAGWGRSRANPSIQPRDYADGLVAVLGIVAACAVAIAIAVSLRERRSRAGS